MYPAPIEEYYAPESIADAIGRFAAYGEDACYLAGGQSVMQAIKARLVRPRCIIDLQKISEMKGISVAQDCAIGAMTRYRTIAEDTRLTSGYAALRDAAGHVGDRQVRNRGTIGGSLCWNYVAACMPIVNLGLGSVLTLRSDEGERVIEIDEFLGGPMETARRDGELLTGIRFHGASARSGSAYKKWSLLSDGLPVIGVCVKLSLGPDERCDGVRVAIGGLQTGPVRSAVAEDMLVGSSIDDVTIHDAAFREAALGVNPGEDLWADAEHRRALIRVVGREVTSVAFKRALNDEQ